MSNFYKKECPFDGSQEPSPYPGQQSKLKIPNKCGGCQFFFEYHCRKIRNRLLRLDYGFCGIVGSKELVNFENSLRLVPLKCTTCQHLTRDSICGLACLKDRDKWGEIPRGLDY